MKKVLSQPLFTAAVCFSLVGTHLGQAPVAPAAASQATAAIVAMPGLAAFWDFREEAGEKRQSLANPPLTLQEVGGPIARVQEGPFGTAIKIKSGQWLRVPRKELGPLNIHGPQAAVTVVAWIQRERTAPWQAIAGVWDETRKKRQYCLFLNAASKTDHRTMTRTPCKDLFQGHVSAVGGPTPGERFCITYASSASKIPFEDWQCLALTYDSKEVRLYLNGRLDAAEGTNPFPYADGLFDGGEDGGEFTVGSVSVAGKPGNFFGGKIGGLAVFSRALSPAEILSVHESTQRTKASE